MKRGLKELSRESLQEIIMEMADFMSEKERQKLETLIEKYRKKGTESSQPPMTVRMGEQYIEEKMKELKGWMEEIEEGELYLETEGYEDYSAGYWDSDWVTEYYDNQGIGDKILSAIRFAKDCVDDRRYVEANFIYEWLWSMTISTDSEFEEEPVDLELLITEKIVDTDTKQLALLTLYADYQVQKPERRAGDIYLYFSYGPFRGLHIEDMFHVGRENLTGEEQFWEDWIALLITKSGNMEGRLLKEAVIYREGAEGLVKMADENCSVHPSLYLEAVKEYEKKHDYERIEEIGERALEKLGVDLVIRSVIALNAAFASSCLMKKENVMRFCWEGFCSDTNDRNFLRLFGTEEMAERYGMRGKEVLGRGMRGKAAGYVRNDELQKNIVSDHMFYKLSFYTGDFEKVREISKNPKGSLGWSSCFIREGIRLFLLYLYEEPWPSKAADSIAYEISFGEGMDSDHTIDFENDIIEESRQHKASIFWNYFQRWKRYYPMEQQEKRKYLSWAEKIVYERADALVSGQHRNCYAEAAALLAMIAEIKEGKGIQGEKQKIFAEYKGKFPRHSAFLAEMKYYFDVL